MGQEAHRADISNVSQANPCVVTTAAAHGFETGFFVRITDLNGCIPTHRGMDQINNRKFRIVVLDNTSFSLQDATTYKPLDSSDYTAYVSNGRATKVEDDFYYS